MTRSKRHVVFSRRGGQGGDLGLITLNRPTALNALTERMCIAITEQLQAWGRDDLIKAVVIRGAGERAFCAGGDVRAVYKNGHGRQGASRRFFWHEYRMNHCLFHFSKPCIALMHGVVMGGGLGISVHGSHRVAAYDLVMAMPETGIGFFPDIGGSYFLSRCPERIGLYLGLTGARMGTGDAKFIGLLDERVPRERFDELIGALADMAFTEDAKTTVTMVIRQYSDPPQVSTLHPHRDWIDRCFGQASVEEIFDALRAAEEPAAGKILATLRKKSPTSLKVTYAQFHRARQWDFDEAMRMEYRMSGHFLEGHDFYEGVRAALIDKDNRPRWRPARLADISDRAVERHFAPLKSGELLFKAL